jgi:ABC-2 type transport system permease protein
LALIIGVNLRLDPLDVIGVCVVVVLFAMCFASLSMTLASFLRTRDRMMGIGQAITIPLFFGSNAIYPVSLMPVWLQYISKYNPLSYVVDAMRAMLLTGDYSGLPLDMFALLLSTTFFIACASVVLRRLIE